MPGKPKRIVCDEAPRILRPIEKVWPSSKPDSPFVALCVYHVEEQAIKILRGLGLYEDNHPMKKAVDEAFWDEAHWADLVTLARKVHVPVLDRWLVRHESRIATQVKLPCQPNSIGALEEKLKTVKHSLFERRFCLRNRERLNRLLMLMRVHANRLDTERHYSQLIRECLLKRGGGSGMRRIILDRKGCSSHDQDIDNGRLRGYG